ncbi:MAG: T9SS type A sorting domain-containing protein [Ginsengibacter sp.]
MKNFEVKLSVLIGLLFSTALKAQFRNYTLVYSGDSKSSVVMFGNTLMNLVDTNTNLIDVARMNDNGADGNSIYGNDANNMQYTDVDGSTGSGSETRNSSSADLTLPAGINTIKLARLYWGGRVKTADFDMTQTANQKIKIRKGTLASYDEFVAAQIDKSIFIQGGAEYVRYQAIADVTSFIQSNGAGSYSAGNAPLSSGAIDNGGNYGGWCIIVVFENAALDYNSVRLYDGFEQVFDNGNPLTTSITLTGLNVPSGTLAATDAKMGVAAWEGDANLTGDFLKINGNIFSNEINAADNPWNGTISDNGVHVTAKNPNYTNQMGIDIDQFYAGTGYGITPNATSAILEFGTEADQYFPGVFSFVIKAVNPLPLSFIYFNGITLQNKNAKITWGTSLEKNCSYFVVERSFDGNSFTAFATVQGNTTTSLQHDYSIIDDLSGVTSPLIYYRLKQVDQDGKKSYSRVITLRANANTKPLLISSNPFINYFNINVNWDKDEASVLNILDASGKKLAGKKIFLNKGFNNIKVDDVALFSPGTYILRIVSKNKKIVEKIVKQ